MRKGLCIIICALLLMSCNVYVFADEVETCAMPVDPGISPMMEYIARSSAKISADENGLATINCQVYGYMGTTTRVEIVAELQRYVSGRWVTIGTFTAESNSHRVTLSETYSLTAGYNYRVQATVTAYSGSAVESDVVTSGMVSY